MRTRRFLPAVLAVSVWMGCWASSCWGQGSSTQDGSAQSPELARFFTQYFEEKLAG